MNKNKKKKIRAGLKIGAAALLLTGAAVFLERLARAVKEPENIDDDNPYLEPSYIGNGWDEPDALMQEPDEPTVYERFGKRALDKVVSFCGLVLLAPLFGLIAVAIEIDDPGPVLFKQKRVGKDKRFFEIHKFRSMKKSAPTDVPIERFEDQEEYMTRVGRFLRRTYLDELPQLWDVFRGKMSLVGPRPVIWNTKELIEERDKYGANNVMPGITGLAQLNGGIELNNKEKAEWDGKYVKILREGNLEGFLADAECLVRTAETAGTGFEKGETEQE